MSNLKARQDVRGHGLGSGHGAGRGRFGLARVSFVVLAVATAVVALATLGLSACSSSSSSSPSSGATIVIGGIPDQDVSTLEQRFGDLANYLTQYFADLDPTTNAPPPLKFRYQPSSDYAAIVTAFTNGDIQLGWFGGLTGVQARAELPQAEAIAQRAQDAEFRSVWIVRSDISATTLADLSGRSFTFGSEISTSGRLMPQHFLAEQGFDIDRHFSVYSFSGSHDNTWQLVEAGTYDAGVLNKSVWDAAVTEGRVDTSRVRVLEVTPPYYDYHWLAHPDIDRDHGTGTAAHIAQALLELDDSAGGGGGGGVGEGQLAQQVLDGFLAEQFIAADNANYAQIEAVARQLGLLRTG